jgi:serine/threonine protein kinase
MLKQIGEGSYGIIYLVEEKYTHKKCALKKIIAHNYDEVKVFLNEF